MIKTETFIKYDPETKKSYKITRTLKKKELMSEKIKKSGTFGLGKTTYYTIKSTEDIFIKEPKNDTEEEDTVNKVIKSLKRPVDEKRLQEIEERSTKTIEKKNQRPELKVSNIGSCTKDDILYLFNFIGPVCKVYIPTFKDTQENRDFAFVSYYDERNAEKAIARLNNHAFNSVILKVEWSRTKN